VHISMHLSIAAIARAQHVNATLHFRGPLGERILVHISMHLSMAAIARAQHVNATFHFRGPLGRSTFGVLTSLFNHPMPCMHVI
jgi:hypothetical protein